MCLFQCFGVIKKSNTGQKVVPRSKSKKTISKSLLSIEKCSKQREKKEREREKKEKEKHLLAALYKHY